MNLTVKSVLQTLRQRFDIFYGDRLAQMVLFGSRARGDARPDSDIDVLVVLHGAVHDGEEVERTCGLVADLGLENDVVISCMFIEHDRYENGQGRLLRNIRKEGVAL